ncbi:coniferyl aldehyde dehydrogenase [Echinimonas agarilytica]|uniref:Aldehyde dehydrogenase n=1 Tax=Echinimonas agarilytica TaxID=1215918 RepID=A0AA42B618_9GAMM|nr:coniferyl aldehyde dehydrogenase [Echinimonas agarilytica]
MQTFSNEQRESLDFENSSIQSIYATRSELGSFFAAQRQAFSKQPERTYPQRKSDLQRLHHAFLSHQHEFSEALNQDFGHRAGYDSMLLDVLPTAQQFRYTLSRLKSWMKPSRRHVGMALWPASVKVHYQAKGVVGIIVPWNVPLMLSFGPLMTALAAGNRVMLKLSEFTPQFNRVCKTVIEQCFESHQVAVIEGEADIAAEFSALPFDHLLFTGSTQVGRHVMATAAKNLTPVTLELGGKSPVLIAPDCDIEFAVNRLMMGKCLNAGQICIAPDYILCPQDKVEAFKASFKKLFLARYPKGIASKDYSSIINARQYARLKTILTDAERLGASISPVMEPSCDDEVHRMLPHLISDVSDDMAVMQDELFGPILPIVSYQTFDQALAYVNERPRPLALYLMSLDKKVQSEVLSRTHSGGVALNETLYQCAADDAPFGGIGPSGMGHYHGKEGFITFSHAKTVFKRGRLTTAALVTPPYQRWWQKVLFKVLVR